MTVKSHMTKRMLWLGVSFMFSPVCYSLPSDPVINHGAADITQQGNVLEIEQHSAKVSIDYSAFDIGANEQVIFRQPSTNAIALNRVIGNNPSHILGGMTANGTIFLINDSGIIFGENAHIDVGGLIASTSNISDESFLSGQYRFTGESSEAIVNQGLLQAAKSGLLVLIGDELINHGDIKAEQGHVALIASDDVTVNNIGGTVSIHSSKSSLEALIENHGLIEADGGMVVFNADAMNALEQTVVNNTGVIRANSIQEQGGEIYITGSQGDVIVHGAVHADALDDVDGGTISIEGNRVAIDGLVSANGALDGDGGSINIHADDTIVLANGATLSVDGGTRGDGGDIIAYSPGTSLFRPDAWLSSTGGSEAGDGGFIEVSGLETVEVFGHVDTSAANGESGLFYIDPYDITISAAASANGAFDGLSPDSWEGSGVGTSSVINTAAITSALLGGDVVIDTSLHDGSGPGTGTGDIHVDAAIDLNGGDGNQLSLLADNDINVNANICEGGGTCAPSNDAVNLVFTAGNNITVDGAAEVNSGDGTILIQAGSADINGLVESSNTTTSAIQVLSGSYIQDGGGAGVNLDAAGRVVLSAATGIDIDIDAATLSVTNATSGNVVVNANNAVTLSHLAFQGGDATISTANGGDLSLSTDIDLDGLDGHAINLTASGDLDTPNGMEIKDASGAGDDAVDLNFTAGGMVYVRINNEIRTHGGDLTINAVDRFEIRNASFMGSGQGKIAINARNVILVGELASYVSATDAITIVAAERIRDGGASNVDVQTNAGGLILQAGTGIDLDTQVAFLNATNTTSGDIIIEETNALEITNLASAGDAIFTVGDVLTIPDAGLSVGSNNLTITASDIIDPSGRNITFSANQLSLDVTNPSADMVLATDVASLQAIIGGASSLSVIENDDLILSDLGAHGAAINITNGALDISSGALTVSDDVVVQQGDLQLVSAGDMSIDADLLASDAVADGTREGMIDLAVNNGDLTVGTTNAVLIQSTNNVDQTADGGLGSAPSNQVSIRIRQLDTSDSAHEFVFGDGVGSDVAVTAVGGDIFVDSINNDTIPDPQVRRVILNSDVSVDSYNNLLDAQDGTTTLYAVTDSGASVSARTDRLIQLNQSPPTPDPAPAPTPDPAPAPAPDPTPDTGNGAAEELDDIVSDVLAPVEVVESSQTPLESSEPSIVEKVESDSLQVSNTFEYAYGDCAALEEKRNAGQCNTNSVLVQFLGRLLIGGALPGGG